MNFKQILEIEIPPEHGLLTEMNSTGDTRIIWDRHNADEVEAARQHFNLLRKKGMAAYRVTGSEGVKGEVISEFDPTAERIIMAPPLRGGADSVLELLHHTRALLARPEDWIKGQSFDGFHRRCLTGALLAASNRNYASESLTLAVRMLKSTISRLYYCGAMCILSIENWNDDKRTEHRDVLRVLDAAIAEVEMHEMWKELNEISIARVAVAGETTKEEKPLLPEVEFENVGVR